MQYMLMIFGNEQMWATMPKDKLGAIMGEFRQFSEAIVKSGHFRSGSQLHPTTMSTTVRQKGDKPVITDGPFVETKEQLGGYYVVECKDLDEALSIAARVPSVKIGDVVEVRPMVAMAGPPAR